MYNLTANLKLKKDVNWYNWENLELKKICYYFVKNKICEKRDDEVEQFQYFEYKVTDLYDNKEKLLSDMIKGAVGLKTYLQTHSIFQIGDNKSRDWLIKEMIKLLEVSEEDIKLAFYTDKIPQEILDKLAIFDIEPIGLESDSIQIKYAFYSKYDPIQIIDTDWEKNDDKKVSIEKFLAKYKSEDLLKSSEIEIDNDIPF